MVDTYPDKIKKPKKRVFLKSRPILRCFHPPPPLPQGFFARQNILWRYFRTFLASGAFCKHAFAVPQNGLSELLVRHIEGGAGSSPHGRNSSQWWFVRIHVDPLGCTTARHWCQCYPWPSGQARTGVQICWCMTFLYVAVVHSGAAK